MMRPMKLAGQQLMFGQGCLAHLKTLDTKRAIIVTGGSSMKRNGIFDEVVGYLHEAGAEVTEFGGVEADPSFRTVWAGAEKMKEFKPDLIIGLGGGSAMDAAKMMWVYYEHPELTTLEEVLTAKPFPKLRQKALYCCIPSTSGTASEVSRSVVITGDDGMKHGLGNMEMMPDIAICDPRVTASMPPHMTAHTGMDAMTHALEALVSNRANYVSDVLAIKAVEDIYEYLPKAYENGADLDARERMLNASTIAGMAFTNVSLGIVHSMAHTVGSLFHVAHGLADAVILPYVIAFNSGAEYAKEKYAEMAKKLGQSDMIQCICSLNEKVGIPKTLCACIPDERAYMERLDEMAKCALADGCTKTNPIIPTPEQLKELFIKVYRG